MLRKTIIVSALMATLAASARPQFHFTAPAGAINNPNGMTYFKGEWHLFYQYKPDMKEKGIDKYWGHAVSKDLVHWRHLPPALAPDEHGMCYSGSGAIDCLLQEIFATKGSNPGLLHYRQILYHLSHQRSQKAKSLV